MDYLTCRDSDQPQPQHGDDAPGIHIPEMTEEDRDAATLALLTDDDCW